MERNEPLLFTTRPCFTPASPLCLHLSTPCASPLSPPCAPQVEQSATVCAPAAQPAELLALLQQLMVGEFKVCIFLPISPHISLYLRTSP